MPDEYEKFDEIFSDKITFQKSGFLYLLKISTTTLFIVEKLSQC